MIDNKCGDRGREKGNLCIILMSGLVILYVSSNYRLIEVRVFMHASRLAKAIHAAREGTREGKEKEVWNSECMEC